MAHTYHQLKEKTIQELRDIAKDVQHDAVQGFSQMNKEHLLPALCTALGRFAPTWPDRRAPSRMAACLANH